MSDSERELRAVFESAIDAILIADDSGRYVDANPAACALLGVPLRDLLGRGIADFMAPGSDFGGSWGTFLEQGRLSGEMRLVRPDGSPIDVEFNAISSVTPGRHLSILRDVSERKRTEAALRRSEQELNDFFENASIGLHWAAPDGRILRVNQSELDLLGYTREEYLGHPMAELHADPEVAEDILERLRRGETLHNYRARLRHKDGSVRHVLISSNTYRENGEFVHSRSFTRDISDLARAEDGLQLLAAAGQVFAESLDYERTLWNAARLAIPDFAEWCVIDIVAENGRLRRLVTIHADPGRQPLIEKLQRYPPTWEDERGAAMILRTGQPVFLPAVPPEWIEAFGRDAEHRRLLRDLDPRSVISVPLVARGRRLGVWGFFRTFERPFSDNDFRLAETLARRAALAIDNARLYREAESANRSKDQFLASLSHELRTPLTPVLMLVSQLERDGRVDEDLRRDLAVIRKNIELEARLIDDLLDLTRIARGKVELSRQVTNVHALLEHAIQICSTEAVQTGRLAVESDMRAPDARVWADGPRLTQVFWNLLSNAVKFTPEGGTVRVSTWTETLAAAGPERLFVEISDTGIGIEPETLPRIFGAFEQGGLGRPMGLGGLGLGLAISKAILELHGGGLSAASAGPGRGSTFTAWIPRGSESFAAAGPLPEKLPESDLPQPASGGRPLSILLVEDHADTAEALADLLRDRGYDVTVAGSLAAARQAVAVRDGQPGIDLVLSDLGLPDGSGHELMAELSGRYGLRGIALSGYGMEEDLRKSREAGFALHLTKPVSPRALEDAIRKVAG
jgi:PAS domain S-box-containing protein